MGWYGDSPSHDALQRILSVAHQGTTERLSRQNLANVEVAELSVLCADFVESHLGHDALEVEWIAREERHSPLPLIESNRTSDDLLNSPCVFSAGQSVCMHQPAPLLERK